MFLEEREPAFEDARLVLEEDEAPQTDGHLDRQRPLARVAVEAKLKRPPVEVFEGVVALHLGEHLGELGLDSLDRVDSQPLAAAEELAASEATHRLGIELPREDQHAELLWPHGEVLAELLNAVRL